jgi:hypothetical protein
MFEHFTRDARQVILASVRSAADEGAPAGPRHLLLALATDDGPGGRVLAGYGVTATRLRATATDAGGTRRAGLTDTEIAALRTVGIDADEVFRRIEEAFGPDAFEEPDPPVTPAPRRRRGLVGGPFDRDARKVVELSLREAIALRDRRIGSEHILLGLLRAGVPGRLSDVLAEHGVTYDDARRRTLAEPRA